MNLKLKKLLYNQFFWDALTMIYGVGFLLPLGIAFGFSGVLLAAPQKTLLSIIFILWSLIFSGTALWLLSLKRQQNLRYIDKTYDLVTAHFNERGKILDPVKFMGTRSELFKGFSPRELLVMGRAKAVFKIISNAIAEGKRL